MTNSTKPTPAIRPYIVGAGAIASAANLLMLANNFVTLVDYFQRDTPTASTVTTTTCCGANQHHQPCEQPEQEQFHFLTENWVVSPEHDTAVLLDIRSTGLTKSQALAGLRKAYPRKEDTIGVRMLANNSKMLIVFATPDLQEHALLYGFQMNGHTTLYPTKALDNSFTHTLLTIDNLPIDDRLTTRQKLGTSLDALFLNVPNPRRVTLTQENESNKKRNPWPPTVHDVFFHQSVGGYYDGKVTVILRGSVTFLQRSIRLEAFDASAYNCRVRPLSSYCHHCMRIDRHQPQHCPHVPLETS